MIDQYIPHLQRHCSAFLLSKKNAWDRFDVADFLQKCMEIQNAAFFSGYRDAIVSAVGDMCQESPAIAEVFLQDSFTRLGFKFSWGLCQTQGLSISATFMASNLDVLQANMDSHDHEKEQLPQRIFTTNIFSHVGIEGLKEPVINPLMLKMLLGANGPIHEAKIESFFNARPLNSAYVELIRLVKGMDESTLSKIAQTIEGPDVSMFMRGLAQLEELQLIDPERVRRSSERLRVFAAESRDLVLALYDDEFASGALTSIYKRNFTSTRVSIGDAHLLKVKSVLNIIDNHKGGVPEAIEIVRESVMGVGRFQYSSKDEAPEYAHFAHALLQLATQSEPLGVQVLSELCTEIGTSGIVRKKQRDLAKILFQVGGEPTYKSLMGVSPKMDELLGDLTCHLVRIGRDGATLKAGEGDSPVNSQIAQHLLDAGVFSAGHVKRLLKNANGRKLCQGVRIPPEMLQRLPSHFRDETFGADLGL
ncbi:hypothetical protein [Pseudomonas amygdali]|uniref:Uncharacterized protein n=2 Tax=Pseudomonas amygdali pv. lachrymans TaxID=53707 RepID=A0ABR5KTG0_PSEAV|nr:hypothetical protein [Pseudomonas amygdali]AXH59745.1 hypothetical protein PLA107_031475 [Pseudomonas amygdali pv. lachrymans str. M301315]KPC17167.1 Uncharacterized protein AC499_0369 [Pseudomonas amygdali pv. lachrymans]KPC18126.1 Uncharacterized protein AC499_1328 [Pseudomonas amygdali pv. lachrymans]RMT06198.1 hypothetical protein ALP54_03647 [Pseudomonas amygdali pv. lachrymans]